MTWCPLYLATLHSYTVTNRTYNGKQSIYVALQCRSGDVDLVAKGE